MKEERTAMIFAAGLGTRLYPLTANKPKALVEINGVTLLERSIRKLESAGIRHIIINIHHFGEQIIDFLAQHTFTAQIDISDERNQLLDTAGGLKHAEPLLGNAKEILLYNVDILSDIDLNALYTYHHSMKAVATIAIRRRQTSRYFLFDKENTLCGWCNHSTGEKNITRLASPLQEYAFSGIHILNRKLLSLIPPQKKLSITPFYLNCAEKYLIKGYLHTNDFWIDCGKIQDIEQLQQKQLDNLL